jgi:cytochrome P450
MLPLNPLVIPHKSLQDDVYKGMLIPAGSVVFANTKAMCSNPETYADPDVFDPGRYERGEPHPVGNFGFGRRKCPGNWLALASVWAFVANLLAIFRVDMMEDGDGGFKEPVVGLTFGLGG